jgi:hypothetical protein
LKNGGKGKEQGVLARISLQAAKGGVILARCDDKMKEKFVMENSETKNNKVAPAEAKETVKEQAAEPVKEKKKKKVQKTASSKKKVKQIFSLSQNSEREIELEDRVIKKLAAEAEKAGKKGGEITISDLVANLAIEKAHGLKFRLPRSEMKTMKLRLPTGLWTALDGAAKRNKANLSETITALTKDL